jgi:hypothetical protein
MLHRLSPALLISFSLRQGDPLAMLLYIIQLQPLLFILQRVLAGLSIGVVRETALGYVDDVAALSTSLADLEILDTTVSYFEAVSGALLNRNRKSVVVGLGSWAGCLDWLLQWIGAAAEVKIYGVVIAPTFAATVSLSWDQVAAKFETTLHLWAARRLPTLYSSPPCPGSFRLFPFVVLGSNPAASGRCSPSHPSGSQCFPVAGAAGAAGMG